MDNRIGPFEQIILNTYDLTAYGRTINKPLQNPELSSALETVDQKSGNNDGNTTIGELREHLSFVSAWEEDYFHNKYYQQLIPEIHNELQNLETILNVELIDPLQEGMDDLEKYVDAALAYNLIYWQKNDLEDILHRINNNVSDQLITEIKTLESSINSDLSLSTDQIINNNLEPLSLLGQRLLQVLSPEEKIEQLNIIIKSKQFLGIEYHPDYGKTEGLYGLQSPLEIFNTEKPDRTATCSELTYLGFDIARAFNLPAKIVQLEYLVPDIQEDLQGENIDGVQNIKHMTLLFNLDNENVFLDLTLSSHYQRIEHIKAMEYQQIYSKAIYQYDELDYLEMLSSYYQDTAGWLMYYNTESRLPEYNSFFQASYILDPINEEDDFFWLFYSVKERAEAFEGQQILSSLFIDIYGPDRPQSYNYLIDQYVQRNPYNSSLARSHAKLTGNNWFILHYQNALNSLLSVDINNKEFFITNN